MTKLASVKADEQSSFKPFTVIVFYDMISVLSGKVTVHLKHMVSEYPSMISVEAVISYGYKILTLTLVEVEAI